MADPVTVEQFQHLLRQTGDPSRMRRTIGRTSIVAGQHGVYHADHTLTVLMQDNKTVMILELTEELWLEVFWIEYQVYSFHARNRNREMMIRSLRESCGNWQVLCTNLMDLPSIQSQKQHFVKPLDEDEERIDGQDQNQDNQEDGQ